MPELRLLVGLVVRSYVLAPDTATAERWAATCRQARSSGIDYARLFDDQGREVCSVAMRGITDVLVVGEREPEEHWACR